VLKECPEKFSFDISTLADKTSIFYRNGGELPSNAAPYPRITGFVHSAAKTYVLTIAHTNLTNAHICYKYHFINTVSFRHVSALKGSYQMENSGSQ